MAFFLPVLGAILQFPSPSEVNTSPKSWRRLSLFDRASRLLLDPNSKGRQQSHGDKRQFPAGRPFSRLSLRRCRGDRRAGYRHGLEQSGHGVANPQGQHFRRGGDGDRHRHPSDGKSGLAGSGCHGCVDRQIRVPAGRRSIDGDNASNRRRAGGAAGDGRYAGARGNGRGSRTCHSEPGRVGPASDRSHVQAVPGLGGRGRCARASRASQAGAGFTPGTGHAGCPCTGRAGSPGSGPAREEAATGSVRA